MKDRVPPGGIFVTVGTQLTFDRMIRAIDAWAAERGRTDVFAQVGPVDWEPRAIGWTKFLEPPAFRENVQAAGVVVAHAGMGSIITALEMGKPILVMPRRAELREHRNDHQVATCRRFLEQGRINVAFDEKELAAGLDRLGSLAVLGGISAQASPELIGTLRGFIAGEPV